ncbi:MAG: hypothetical protein ACOCRK_08825 [bacterium]
MDLENFISNLLRKYPKLREKIKLTYQFIFYNLSKLNLSKNKSLFRNKIRRITSDNKEHYFGYYDKSPWNKRGDKLLTLQIPFSDKHPNGDYPAEVAYINLKDNTYNKIDQTKTWNLQQGSMLQWLGPDFNKKIIYNDFINNKYVSIIYNLENKNKTIMDKPVYSVDQSGKFALSLNFSRLHRLRPGYGYSNLVDDTKGESHPKTDGIYFVDLKNNESKLIISLDQIVKINHTQTMQNSEHRFNHLDISPDGTRFSFIHRWEHNNVTQSRFYTADINGNNIYCLADEEMVSHSCWKNNKQILVWARKDNKDRYYLFKDQSEKSEIIGEDELNSDGHPSYSPDKRYILTDTYPDRTRHRTLIIYDTKENKRYDIARLFAPFKYHGEVRCDLHPRWSRDGKSICFDSVHEGKRQLYIVENVIKKLEEIK